MHFLFLSFITFPPRCFLYFHIVYKGWAEKQVLERFQTGRKGRKMEGPITLSYRDLLLRRLGSRESGDSLAVHVFQYQICLNNHGFWI